MEDKDIQTGIVELQCEYKEISRRIALLEESQAQIQDLVISVNKLANNMQHMLEEQKAQNKRLEAIESAPTKDYHELKMKVVSTIITSIVSLIVGAVMALVIKK